MSTITGLSADDEQVGRIIEAAVLYNVTRLQGQDVMPEIHQATTGALNARSCEPEVRDRVCRLLEGMVIQSGNLCWNHFERMIGYDENLTVSDYWIIDNELLYIVVE